MPTIKHLDVPEELKANPLLQDGELPLYHLIEAKHVEPAVQLILTVSEKLLKKVESEPSIEWSVFIEPLERIELLLEKVWSPVNHLLAVRNSDELREVHEKVQPEVVKFGLKMGQSELLYEKYSDFRASAFFETLTRARQRVIELRLRDAKLAGVGLKGLDRKAFNDLAEKISQAGTQFSNHVLDATKSFEMIVEDKAETDGWPASLLQLSHQSYVQAKKPEDPSSLSHNTGPWRITLDYPVYVPFIQHCAKRELREKVYRAFVTRASSGEFNNRELIEKILGWRQKQAELLGYANYAEVSLAAKMAPDFQAVDDMHQSLLKVARPVAEQELQELRQYAERQGQSEPLMNWDVGYWAEQLREEVYGFNDEMLRPYFPIERVLEGMFEISNRLLQIEVRPSERMLEGEAHAWKAVRWHEDIRLYDVYDKRDGEADGKLIARFFLDPYARPEEKRGGAWMDVCVTKHMVDGELKLPVAHLICNGTPPVRHETKPIPSLMSFNEVETLFHEFGHGLQGMLSTQQEADISGIGGIEWDAVEIASQFMENWLYDKQNLTRVARHYETNETMPDSLLDKVIGARNYRAASVMIRQIQFGMTDMALHISDSKQPEWDPFEIETEITNTVAVMPPLAEDRFLCSFSHIFAGGYAAGYYSYKWSEVLSADVFAAFEEAGLEDDAAMRAVGKKYRDTFLSLGGGEDPMVVFKSFRQREPDVSPLLRHMGLAK